MGLLLCTQMARLKSTPWLLVLQDMLFILSVVFLFRPPFLPTSAKQSIPQKCVVPSKPCVLLVQPGWQYKVRTDSSYVYL